MHPYPRFCFLRFQLPAVNRGLKVLHGKFQNKQLLTFRLKAIQREQRDDIPHPPSPSHPDLSRPFVKHLHAAYMAHPSVT